MCADAFSKLIGVRQSRDSRVSSLGDQRLARSQRQHSSAFSITQHSLRWSKAAHSYLPLESGITPFRLPGLRAAVTVEGEGDRVGRLDCSQSFHSSSLSTNCIWGHRGQERVGCTSPLAGYVQLGWEVGRGSHSSLGTRDLHELPGHLMVRPGHTSS